MATQTENAESGSAAEEAPMKEGAIAGAGAFVAGFVGVAVLAFVDSEIEIGESEFGTFTELGWFFYASHYVDMSYSFGPETETQSLFADGSTQIPEVVFYLVPAIVLVGVGFWLANQFADLADSGDSIVSGAAVVIGYLPLVAVGTFLFEESESMGDFSMSIGPDLVQSLVFAGLIFPIVFGAIGGYLAHQQAQ